MAFLSMDNLEWKKKKKNPEDDTYMYIHIRSTYPGSSRTGGRSVYRTDVRTLSGRQDINLGLLPWQVLNTYEHTTPLHSELGNDRRTV